MKHIFGNPQLSKETLQLQTLEHTLKTRTPYAVMQIATTCDETKAQKDFSYPIRVCVKEFSYNWKTDRYEETIAFDKLVKCPENSLKFAVDHLHFNNVFERNGIDKDAYINGENVLDTDTFKKELSRFISAISENPNEPLIISNDNYSISNISALEKINCADVLQNMNKAHRVLSITDLTKAHFNEKSQNRGVNYNYTLDSVKQYLEKNGTVTIEANNKPLPEARIKTVCDFATYFGRYVHTFSSRESAEETMKKHEEIEGKIEGGKLKYRDSSLEEKLKTIMEMGQISPDMLNRDSDCDLNKLYDIYEGKGPNGIVIMQVATTGTGNRATPIQFTAMALAVNEGKFKPESYISFNIQCASKNNLEYALQNKEYDTFAKAGINREDYLKGINVKPFEEATKVIDNFMKKYEDYAIVSSGSYFNNKKISFTQGAMKSICNFPWTSVPAIDFQNIEKQYAYRTHYSDKYDKNVLFDESKWGTSTFRLEDLASYHNRNIIGTRAKCEFMCDMLSILAKQYMMLVKGELHAEHIQPIDIDGKKSLDKTVAEELRSSLPSDDSPIVVIENLKADIAKEPDDIHLIDISENISSAYENPEIRPETNHDKKSEPVISSDSKPEKDSDGSFIESEEDIPADIISDKDEKKAEVIKNTAVSSEKPQSLINVTTDAQHQKPTEEEKQKKIERLKRIAGGVKYGNKTYSQADSNSKAEIKEDNGFAYIKKTETDILKDVISFALSKETTQGKYEKADIEKFISQPSYLEAFQAVIESNKNKQVKMSGAGLSKQTFDDILDADILHVARNIENGKSLLEGIIIEPKPEKPMDLSIEPTPVQHIEEPKQQETIISHTEQNTDIASNNIAEEKQEPVPERVIERVVEKPTSGMDVDTTKMLASILAATNRQTDAIRGQTEAIREQANAEKDLLQLQISQSQNNIEALLAQNQAMTSVLREAVVQFSRAYTVVNEIALGRDINEQTAELLADVSAAMQNISRQLDKQKTAER